MRYSGSSLIGSGPVPVTPGQHLPVRGVGAAYRCAPWLPCPRRMAKARSMRPKIVIIGGGISGLAAGIAFARRGLEPVIYEQAPELQEVGAGVTLWANAFRALE